MREVWWVIFVLLIFALVLVIVLRLLEQGKKEDIFKTIRGKTDDKPIFPGDVSEDQQELLRKKYQQSRLKLEEAYNSKGYASLIETLIPRIQQLMGWYRYRFPVFPEEKLLEDLKYLLGVNLNNELTNQGFRINDQGIIENVRANRMQLPPEAKQDLPEAELKQLIESYEKERARLAIYRDRKELCNALGKPLLMLRRPMEAGKINRETVRHELRELEQTFLRFGFEFKYYEDFPKNTIDAKQFIHGDEWTFDYPALYQNGTLYCDYVGRRRGD